MHQPAFKSVLDFNLGRKDERNMVEFLKCCSLGCCRYLSCKVERCCTGFPLLPLALHSLVGSNEMGVCDVLDGNLQ